MLRLAVLVAALLLFFGATMTGTAADDPPAPSPSLSDIRRSNAVAGTAIGGAVACVLGATLTAVARWHGWT